VVPGLNPINTSDNQANDKNISEELDCKNSNIQNNNDFSDNSTEDVFEDIIIEEEVQDDNDNQQQGSLITNISKTFASNFPSSSNSFESFEKKRKEMDDKFNKNRAKRIGELRQCIQQLQQQQQQQQEIRSDKSYEDLHKKFVEGVDVCVSDDCVCSSPSTSSSFPLLQQPSSDNTVHVIDMAKKFTDKNFG
jgi:hypothetical protein